MIFLQGYLIIAACYTTFLLVRFFDKGESANAYIGRSLLNGALWVVPLLMILAQRVFVGRPRRSR